MNKPLFKIHDNLFNEKEIDTLYGSFRDEKPSTSKKNCSNVGLPLANQS